VRVATKCEGRKNVAERTGRRRVGPDQLTVYDKALNLQANREIAVPHPMQAPKPGSTVLVIDYVTFLEE